METLDLLVIRLHGDNPFTQPLSCRRSRFNLLGIKLRIRCVLLTDCFDNCWWNVIFVVVLQGFQEVHVTENTLGRSPEVFNFLAYKENKLCEIFVLLPSSFT